MPKKSLKPRRISWDANFAAFPFQAVSILENGCWQHLGPA